MDGHLLLRLGRGKLGLSDRERNVSAHPEPLTDPDGLLAIAKIGNQVGKALPLVDHQFSSHRPSCRHASGVCGSRRTFIANHG
jgi:hypothetical protein